MLETMKIISRYIAGQILASLALVMAAVIGIYLVVDFIEKIDDFMEAGVALKTALLYFVFKVPLIVSQVLPVAVLLAILVTFGLMSKHNEIIALQSSGISHLVLLKPAISIGLAGSLLLFFLTEVVVPLTMAKANSIWLGKVKGINRVVTRQNDIWIKGLARIIHIQYYHPESRTAYGISINIFDRNFSLERRIDARQAVFKDGKWIMKGVMDQYPDKKQANLKVRIEDELVLDLGITLDDLKEVVKPTEEMSFRQLRESIRRIETEGYDTTAYRVDLYGKTAFPFVCLILSCMGVGIAGSGKVRDGLASSVTYGIGVAFFYWTFYSFTMSLGYGAILPPPVAAWLANCVFSILALILLLNLL